MVRSSKGPLAVRAFKGLHSSVLPHVPRKLIGSRKLPVASFPVALVRFFASVRSLVGLEVGALGVHFVASWVGATVYSLIPLRLRIVVDGVY